MPACILLFRIRNIIIPFPWFVVWIILSPFVFLGWLAGSIALKLNPDSYSMIVARESWRILILMAGLHGTEVKVSTNKENILIKFI